jgi:hypothetical protein
VVDQTRVSPGLVFALGRVRTHHGSRAITMLAPFKRFTPLTAGLCVAGSVVIGSRATCCAIAPTDAREHSTSEFASHCWKKYVSCDAKPARYSILQSRPSSEREARKPWPRYRQLMLPLDFGDDRSD